MYIYFMIAGKIELYTKSQVPIGRPISYTMASRYLFCSLAVGTKCYHDTSSDSDLLFR